MATFTPPTEDGVPWGDASSMEPADRLMRYYGAVTTGVTIWKDQNNIYHRSQYPYQAGATHTVFNDASVQVIQEPPGLADAQEVYLGGHTYQITDAQAVQLFAAGFGDYVNIAPVEINWRTEDLPKLTKRVISFLPGETMADPTIDNSGRGVFQLATGTLGQSGGQRDFYTHGDILYQDFEAETIIDPYIYGYDYGGGQQALPQSGIVLRQQEGPTHRTGITLNNNVLFFVPILNVGVWRATLDGSVMENRQYSFPFPDSLFDPYFPYGIGARLTNNIVQARVFVPGQRKPPWENDLTTSPVSKAINLDTDTNDLHLAPTPTGRGTAGIIAAHTGTGPFSQCRFRRTTFRSLDNVATGI